MQRFDESRDGATVELAVGEEFEVELAENPTTGYRWFLDDPHSASLSATGDAFEAGGDARGAPGRRRLRFRAEQAGELRLQFHNRRSWEASAARNFEISVRVKPA
ncbi:MAG: protease inhibitor I42 family protein [Pseudomonadota bacterium]|nr:protease inhibitor I42 family protein [Pseudomonadota bacterium]